MSEVVFCKNCGVKVEQLVNFCSKCGTKLADSPENQINDKSHLSTEVNEIKGQEYKYSKKGVYAAIAIFIIFVGVLVARPGSNKAINPESLVSEIGTKLNLNFSEDFLGKAADPAVDKWFGSGSSAKPISLLFYPDSASLESSAFLKDIFAKNEGYVTCDTFAAFGKNWDDIDQIYKVLIELYPDCKITESSSSTDSGGEDYSSDSVAGSGTISGETNSTDFPVCQQLADTVNSGLHLDPNGGSHWGISTGRPGYCILPNSGGEKFYYSGE